MKASVVVILISLMSPALAWAQPLVEVFKSPRCGCCTKWVDHLRANGFDVKVEETDNLQPIKERALIPAGKGSCHTAFVDGYAIEGHVPATDIKRLLTEKPKAQGLTVPGMPIGSPGMEMGAQKTPYEVLIFQEDGTTEVFSQH